MASENEPLEYILNTLPGLNDSWEIFHRIVKVYSQSHRYLDQWKHIEIDRILVENIIATVRRFEGGFQLKGLGIWLLIMLVSHIKDPETLKLLGSPKTVDALVRIFLEHSGHAKCLDYFVKCIELKLVTFVQIADIGKFLCRYFIGVVIVVLWM